MNTTLALYCLTLSASAGCVLMALLSLTASAASTYGALTLLSLDTPPAPAEYGEVVPLSLPVVHSNGTTLSGVQPTAKVCGRTTKAGKPCRSAILLANGHCRNHQN